MDALALGVGQLQQVVGPQAQHVEVVIHGGGLVVVGAVHLVQLVDAGLVHDGGVGEHGAHHVVGGELVILGHLDAAQHVGDAGDAQPGQLLDELVVQAQLVLHVGLALGAVKQPQQTLAVLVIDGDGHIGVLHVVNPGDVLVADALDAVAAEAVVEDGGALQRLAHAQLQVGIALLQQVAGGHGAGRAGGKAGAGQPLSRLLHRLEQVGQGPARHVVVPQGVAHLLKLVEDHHGGVLLQLPGLVKDLLHVGLAARGGNDLPGDLAEPVKPLLGHLRGQDGHAVHRQQLGVEGAAAAVVAGGGPHGVVIIGVKLTGDQPGGQAAEGGAHLVAPGGEPLARHGDDAAGHAAEGAGDLHVVGHLLEQAAALLGLVLPGDAEQVYRVHVPKAGVRELRLDFLRNQLRVLHLRKGGDDDVVLPGLADVVRKPGPVDSQINLTHFSSPPVFSRRYRNKVCTLKYRNIWPPCRRISSPGRPRRR